MLVQNATAFSGATEGLWQPGHGYELPAEPQSWKPGVLSGSLALFFGYLVWEQYKFSRARCALH